MRINIKFKKLISLFLVGVFCFSNLCISNIYADEITVTQTIKEESEIIEEETTNNSSLKGAAALTSFIKGSPFLTSAWEKQKLERNDLIAMSMYMSSFTYPLIDNYKTTFYTEETYGQKGNSANKLIFQDENKQIAVQDFLNTIIANQSPVEQDIYQISEEKKLRNADLKEDEINEGVTLQEFLFGKDSLDIDDFSEEDINQIILSPTFSQDKYEIGPADNRVTIYDGSSTKQRNLLYLSILRTFNSEFKLDLFSHIKSFLDCPLFIDNFGNICINGLDNGGKSENSDLYIDEDENVVSTLLEGSEELYYPVSNIIILPNCMNSQIVGKINLFSPYFLNGSLVSTSNMEGIYIADANYQTSKQNKFSLVNEIEIGYQQLDLEQSSSEGKKIVRNDVEEEDASVLYRYNVKSDLIYSYFDISGMSPVTKYIFYDKNAPARYFSSSLNLNNLPMTNGWGLNKEFNVNYYATRMLYFNYLLMTKEFYDLKVQVNSKNIFTDDNLGTDEIASSLFIDQNRKIDELISDLWEKSQNPEKKIDNYFITITSILIRAYETLISIPFGSSYLGNIPILSTIYKKIQDNTVLFTVILIGIITILGISKGSALKSFVKGILCVVLITSIPFIYDNAIDIISGLKYSILERSINSWILTENSKYKGIEDPNKSQYYIENISNITRAEELNNTLLYIKSKSPVIINNISEDLTDSIKGSTVGSQIINNILSNNVSQNGKTSSFQDLFKRWEMIIPLWDYASREVSKSLQIEGTADSNKFINKLSSREENENYFTTYNDLSEHRQELENLFSGYESTIGTETYKSFAARDSEDIANVILETRYKRKFTNDEINQLLKNSNLKSEEDIEVNNKLLTNYTLPLGIKGNFSIHNNFYYLDNLYVNTDNKYKISNNNVTIEGLSDNLNTYFPNRNNQIEDFTQDYRINNFNYYDSSKYNKDYGYFILTENVSPYFYTVWYDILGNLTSREIGYAIAGQMNRDEDDSNIINKSVSDGITVGSRDSILMKESNIIDYLDLKELFTNAVPYMNAVSIGSKKYFANSYLLENRYPYYKNNRVNWLYESKWAEELINSFGKQINENTVYSEREIREKGINRELTDFENLIQQFYIELTPLLEELITVADRDEVTKEVLIRQMTILSTLKFNSIFGVLGNSLYPKQIITESLPFDSLWVKFLRDNNYENVGYNFLDMISRQKSTNEALLNVICAFVLTICYFYCIIVLLVTTTLSFLSIFIKAVKNAIDPDRDYFPFMVGCIVLIFKIAFLYIVPQFIIQLTLNSEIAVNGAVPEIFIYLIYAFIYIFLSKSVVPSLISPHVGKIGAFGVFNPMSTEDDLGGSTLIDKVGNKINNVGAGVKTRLVKNDLPTGRITPSASFKRERINKDNNNHIKPTNSSPDKSYKTAVAKSDYQETLNNKAISDINKAIESDKASSKPKYDFFKNRSSS